MNLITRLKFKFHICAHRGCWSRDTTGGYLPTPSYDDVELVAYYCQKHIHAAGFCAICGAFNGGIESFEFGNGMCDNCQIEYERDDDYARDDDEWDDDDPYDDYDQPYEPEQAIDGPFMPKSTFDTDDEIPF